MWKTSGERCACTNELVRSELERHGGDGGEAATR